MVKQNQTNCESNTQELTIKNIQDYQGENFKTARKDIEDDLKKLTWFWPSESSVRLLTSKTLI